MRVRITYPDSNRDDINEILISAMKQIGANLVAVGHGDLCFDLEVSYGETKTGRPEERAS